MQSYLKLGRLATWLALAVALAWGTLPVLAQTPPPNPERGGGAAVAPGEKANTSVNGTAPSYVQPPEGYRVGADDELLVSVWHEPEFSESVVVRPDGMITLPFLNDIKVVGLSTHELQALLTDKLKTLVNDPQVTIVVKNIRSMRVFLVGSVSKQGMFGMTANMTVLELITAGGGLTPFAKTNSIYILRTVDGRKVRIGFNYKKALKGKGDNPELRPGDMVVVP